MTYFYHKKFLKCYLRQREPYTCDQLFIECEFTLASQEDGHCPWHGDNNRDFAECVIKNIDKKPIADILKNNNICGIGKILGCGIKVEDLKKFDNYMPLYHMSLWINFTSIEDTFNSLANFLIDSIPWQVAKEGIYKGESYSGDWEYGKNGKPSV